MASKANNRVSTGSEQRFALRSFTAAMAALGAMSCCAYLQAKELSDTPEGVETELREEIKFERFEYPHPRYSDMYMGDMPDLDTLKKIHDRLRAMDYFDPSVDAYNPDDSQLYAAFRYARNVGLIDSPESSKSVDDQLIAMIPFAVNPKFTATPVGRVVSSTCGTAIQNFLKTQGYTSKNCAAGIGFNSKTFQGCVNAFGSMTSLRSSLANACSPTIAGSLKTSDSQLIGSSHWSKERFQCADGHFVKKVYFNTADYNSTRVITGIRVECSDGTRSNTGTGGSNFRQVGTTECSNGRVGIGFRTYHGARVDKLGLVCSNHRQTDTQNGTLYGESTGGGYGEYLCGQGQQLAGIEQYGYFTGGVTRGFRFICHARD